MFKQSAASNTTRLYSTAGTFGEFDIVATADKIVVDARTRNYDVAGHLHCDHALANLSGFIERGDRPRKQRHPRHPPDRTVVRNYPCRAGLPFRVGAMISIQFALPLSIAAGLVIATFAMGPWR
jgi:hypothetical protein